MNRKVKNLLIVLTPIIGVLLTVFAFIANDRTNHVFTVTCGIVDYKPGVFFKSCADGGIAVGEIKWDSWNKDGATGKGTYAINDCKPNCASGKLSKVAVSVKLTGDKPLTEVRGKRVLNHIAIATLDKKPLPLGTSSSDSWVLE
jgi:hypothetical protein